MVIFSVVNINLKWIKGEYVMNKTKRLDVKFEIKKVCNSTQLLWDKFAKLSEM